AVLGIACQPVYQPASGDHAQPGADERNDLAGEEQREVTMLQGTEHEAEISAAGCLFRFHDSRQLRSSRQRSIKLFLAAASAPWRATSADSTHDVRAGQGQRVRRQTLPIRRLTIPPRHCTTEGFRWPQLILRAGGPKS